MQGHGSFSVGVGVGGQTEPSSQMILFSSFKEKKKESETQSGKCDLASTQCGIRYGNYSAINIGNS